MYDHIKYKESVNNFELNIELATTKRDFLIFLSL